MFQFFLAIIFLSLVFIFVKSLDHLSSDFLQLPTIIPEVTSTQSVINQSGGDAVECQGDFSPETEDRDGSSLNKTQHRQDRTRTDSDQERMKLESESTKLLNEKCINDIFRSSDHAANDQYCTESESDMECTGLEESANDEDDLEKNTSVDSRLSKTVHEAERQDFGVIHQNLKSLTSEKSTNSASLINNKCFNDTLSSNDENSTGLSALESLRRMQVICSEMREALMSARLGSERCNDTCDLYKVENCVKESLDSLASILSIDTNTYNHQTHTHETDPGVYRELDKIDSLQTTFQNDLQQPQQQPQNGITDEESNKIKPTEDDNLTEDEKRVMETEQTIQTFEPSDDFDVMEQSHNTTRDSLGLIVNNLVIFENLINASKHENDSKIQFESTTEDNDIGLIDEKVEVLEKIKDESEHENEFKSGGKPQATNENEPLNDKKDEKSEKIAQNNDEVVGEVENMTITRPADNFVCNADDEAFLSNRGPIDTSSGSIVQLQSPSTISMYEMDEFLFWERLKDVIVRCHKNGQKYSQNISDYYGSTKGKHEDSDTRTHLGNMETQLSLLDRRIEAKKGGKKRIEYGPEMSQYLLDTNSLPRHIFEQESMNRSLGPLVVFFGEVDRTGTSRQVGEAMDAMDEEENKTPIISNETIKPAEEKHTKTMSLDTFQSDQRNNYNFPRNSSGAEVCGRLICYDSSFHCIDSTITPQDKCEKNKKRFDKFYSVYKKFENSEH